MAEPLRTVSFKLPEDLDRALSDLAQQRHSTRSELLREAVRRLIQEKPQSVLARTKDLVGSLKGPADLSTSPRHMDGYGE
jgi:metal-responsive CopG/Arc/MetJ family transcriptional regulator